MSKTFKDLISEYNEEVEERLEPTTRRETEIDAKKETEQDDLECLLCAIMESLGHPKHILRDYKPEKLADLFGGETEVIISLGGPEKAYEEDSFVDMMKDILGMISTEKRYTKDDIKKIREDKQKQGSSLKKLLALMDDDHIEKAFHGMQLFKNGGDIEFDEAGNKINPERKVREAISGEIVILPNDLDKNDISGKNVVHTMKGDGRFFKGKFYFTKNLPVEAGGIKKDAEGDEIKEPEEVPTSELKENQIAAQIGGKEYHLWEAKTPEEKEKGLQGVKELEPNEGMIFYYDRPQSVDYWGKDTLIPLTIAFFDDDEECISVKRIEPMNETLVHEDNVMFVVELDKDADVQPGDDLDLPGDDDEYVMSVLGSDGQSQYELKSGQRIFSRTSTRVIIRKAKKAYKNRKNEKFDNYCKSLGKYVFKELDAQDSRDAEYVSLDNNKDNG